MNIGHDLFVLAPELILAIGAMAALYLLGRLPTSIRPFDFVLLGLAAARLTDEPDVGQNDHPAGNDMPTVGQISPKSTPNWTNLTQKVPINWVRFGFNWVRFDLLKNAKFIATYILVIFYVKFKLGSFRKIHLFAESSKVRGTRSPASGEADGLGCGRNRRKI